MDRSKQSAERVYEEGRKFGYDTVLWNGVHKNDSLHLLHDLNMKIDGSWGGGILANWVGCFLSHYSLWKRSVIENERLMILEHDVVFDDSIEIPEFDGVLNIGKPLWGNWWESEADGIHVRDISKCEKPHHHDVTWDDEYCLCNRDWLRGAHAYVVTPEVSEQLVRIANTKGIRPADTFINSEVRVADYLPYPIWQEQRFSMIINPAHGEEWYDIRRENFNDYEDGDEVWN